MMNRYKIKRNTVTCPRCRQIHLAKGTIVSKSVESIQDVEEMGFTCKACGQWTRLYYETPTIAQARTQLATLVLQASHARIRQLRGEFTALFVQEQERVKKGLKEVQEGKEVLV